MENNFMAKVTGFTISMTQWVLAGCPRRSPEWVAEIFETQCRPCPWYDAEDRTIFGSKGLCTKCGCHVSADHTNPLNKIVDPANACPLDPPRWEAIIEIDKRQPNNEE